MYLFRRPNIKVALVNDCRKFNPQASMSLMDFYRRYAFPFPYTSLVNHANKHITKIEKVQQITITNEKEPIRKVMGELILDRPGYHETPLKEFITQFNEKLTNKERMKVKNSGPTKI